MHSLMTSGSGKARGVSLIELGMVIIFISLAMAPIIKMVGGPQSSSGEGNSARMNGMGAKEAVLANTMVDRVLAGDYTGFDCDASGNPIPFDPKTQLPIGTNAANSIKTFNKCRYQNTTMELYYQWTVVNLNSSNNGSNMPQQNRYYQATFNVIDKNDKILLTMPTNFFYNEGAYTTPSSKTGIMFAMDTSGSMVDSSVGLPGDWWDGPGYFASPFMFYRYKNFPAVSNWGAFPAPPSNKVTLNKWDNSQLDIVYGQEWRVPGPQRGQDPDPTTPNNETFPYAKVHPSNPDFGTWGDGVLGTGDCSTNSGAKWMGGDPSLSFAFIPAARADMFGMNFTDTINNLCGVKSNQANWSNTINKNLSRVEAVRTGALSLLLNLESKPSVAGTIEMGFVPWNTFPDTNPNHVVPLEAAKTIAGVPGIHFETMRDRLLWINRADPASKNSALPILAGGSTDIHAGLEYARQQLLAKNYSRRIIILMTDGEPTWGMGPAGLRNYALNVLGTNASKDQQVTLFSVGLIEADNSLLTDMSNSTPDGQAYVAPDITSLKPIFDAVSYQIQKLALLSTADRYGISL